MSLQPGRTRLCLRRLRAATTVLLFVLSGPLSASDSVATWKEEVQMQEGETLIVQRSQTRGGRREMGQDAPLAKHTVSFVMPGARQAITWGTEYGMEVEKSSLQLLAVDIVSGVPYIVTAPVGCIAYNKWKRPNPPYVVFKYEGSEWRRAELSALPAEIREANVVINTHIHEARLTSMPGVVPAAQVHAINAEAKNPEISYLRVFAREPIRTAQTACEELVYYKGAWIGPGDSIGRRMLDRVGQ